MCSQSLPIQEIKEEKARQTLESEFQNEDGRVAVDPFKIITSQALYNGCTQEWEVSSTDSSKVDEPFKVEEAETVNIPPPPTEKLLVLGGNGFVGSHVCREALDRGLSVASLSRSGRSSLHDPWANNVTWHEGNLLTPESLKDALDGVTSVISCVGGFGSNSYMYKINGTANINAIRAASEQGVKRFVYVSAADFGVVNYLLRGYYEGKLFQHTRPLNQLPLVGPLFTPPVNATAVANVAVRAATDPVFPPGIVDVYGIQRYNQKSK
ncbi:uncharacterized protein Pyn_35874 [Prunus yedoensis var. nudiflora]|uniref:NAD(P)-binding domain-containing protein n=1 Tax=Prunus yedoensis var. nudiflora TaxID=2094558 RepID=A0A314UCU9_PRUYE|nr:uncharacterized protein Pyn_35874 [Prunus yedoensis var. nudiflora]